MKKKLFILIFMVFAGAMFAAGCSSPQSVKSQAPSAAAEKKVQPAQQQSALTVPASVPVLMYHSIGEEKNNDAVISRERFAEQMEFLSREKFTTLTLDELYDYLSEKKPLPPKPVVLTFDDGYRDTYETAFPILKKYGLKSTLFVIASEIGQRLTLEELKTMKAGGMEIMSHSFTHNELGAMTPKQQAEEIIKSKQKLDSLLGQETRYFCYPNGSYNAETFRLLRENGFKLAVTINPGWVKPGDDLLTLQRVWIGNEIHLRYFEERITRSNYTIL